MEATVKRFCEYDGLPSMLRYALTIFLGAFLLFLVQPLIGKYILPWFGGGPGVWTACLLFFQTALLAGYAYAHLISTRIPARAQAIVHVAVVVICLGFLPIIPHDSWKPQGETDPTWRILWLLIALIGLPYGVLAATSPLMQAWFSRAYPKRSPYRLFALSNAGSMLALLLYPAVFEPLATRNVQAWIWSAGFAIFACAVGLCAVAAWRGSRADAADHSIKSKDAKASRGNVPALPRLDVAIWILFPACASVLLLAITTRLSEEIAPLPLLWVLPLAVYLLSFIITFEWPGAYHRGFAVPLLLFCFGLMVALVATQREGMILWQIAGSLAVLLVCCVVCHGEAYRLRPEPARLTAFYLAIAFGGSAGGAFVVLLAPRLFNFNLEFYLALAATFVLLMTCLWRDPQSIFFRGARRIGWLAMTAMVMAAMYGMQQLHLDAHSDTLSRTRNFFGVLSLRELQNPASEQVVYGLYHGRIIHGAQIMAERARQNPTTYFGPESGLGLVMGAFRAEQPRRVGVVGLGVGTIASYARRGDLFRFYEINPAVVDFASHPFTFLNDARNRGADVQIAVGDGRLSLEREPPQQFDVLVLDAFSGDTVPIHLLTAQAFDVYRRHLAEGGVILVHVSNMHIELHLPLMRMAQYLDWSGRLIVNEDHDATWVYGSMWVMLTSNEELLEAPAIKRTALRPRAEISRFDLWTDEHANLLEILK